VDTVYLFAYVVRYFRVLNVMLYYCNMMRRPWWDWELSGWLATLQCFDAVGCIIRRVRTSTLKWPVICQVGCR